MKNHKRATSHVSIRLPVMQKTTVNLHFTMLNSVIGCLGVPEHYKTTGVIYDYYIRVKAERSLWGYGGMQSTLRIIP